MPKKSTRQTDLFKEGIYTAIVRIEKLLMATPITPPTLDPTTLCVRKGHTGHCVKLMFRTFNGDITTWTSIWDSYESAIHLHDIDKLNYLLPLASCSVLHTKQYLAWHWHQPTIMKQYWYWRSVLATTGRHMEILLNVEVVTSQHDLKGLHHLFDLIKSHVRSLKSLCLIWCTSVVSLTE